MHELSNELGKTQRDLAEPGFSEIIAEPGFSEIPTHPSAVLSFPWLASAVLSFPCGTLRHSQILKTPSKTFKLPTNPCDALKNPFRTVAYWRSPEPSYLGLASAREVPADVRIPVLGVWQDFLNSLQDILDSRQSLEALEKLLAGERGRCQDLQRISPSMPGFRGGAARISFP